MASSDLPATSEVLLPTDASKHILDTFLDQGWDSWGASLGGSQASELMLELFSAFNLVALAVVSALFIWIMAIAVAGTAHEGTALWQTLQLALDASAFCGRDGRSGSHLQGTVLFSGGDSGLHRFQHQPRQLRLGAADYFVEHGGQLTVQAPDQNVTHYAAISTGALESLTLQYYLNGAPPALPVGPPMRL